MRVNAEPLEVGLVTEVYAELDRVRPRTLGFAELQERLGAGRAALAAALLDGFRRDREWNDGAAKAQLITIFDSLKPTDPIGQKGRRRLYSLIFA